MRKNSLNYGLVLALILIVFITVIYAIDISLYTTAWIGVIVFSIIVIFGALATIKNKKILHGFLTFKEAFTSFFITIVVGFFIYTLYNIILLNYIDTEAKSVITKNLMKYTADMMQKFGTKAADINNVIAEMEKTDSYGPIGQLKGFVSSLLIFCVIGLITALIIKRDRPQSL